MPLICSIHNKRDRVITTRANVDMGVVEVILAEPMGQDGNMTPDPALLAGCSFFPRCKVELSFKEATQFIEHLMRFAEADTVRSFNTAYENEGHITCVLPFDVVMRMQFRNPNNSREIIELSSSNALNLATHVRACANHIEDERINQQLALFESKTRLAQKWAEETNKSFIEITMSKE